MEQGYYIKADVFGKIKYWSQIDGLHSGHGKLKGHSMFRTEKDAKKEITKLKKVFHNGIKWSIIQDGDLPFIKKQRNKRKKLVNS